MRLVHELNLEQQQKLLMTPELRQAIAILQMSSLELGEYLQEEMEQNPILEIKEESENLAAEKDSSEEEGPEPEWTEYFLDRSDIGYINRENKEQQTYENYLAVAPTLHEHLLFQLDISLEKEEDLNIGRFLIGSIDDNGYLTISIVEAAEVLGVNEDAVLKVLQLIQTFEPYGVGARDLTECLLIQLRQEGKLNTLIEKVVCHHLEDLARGKLAKIAATLETTVVDIQEIADIIRTLDPKPGRQYGSAGDVRYLVPDVTVEKINGEYIVMVNDGDSPRLLISQFYRDMIKKPGMFSKEVRKYLEDKLNSAVWLVKSIEHRRMTLQRVAMCIIDIQSDFLDKGVKYLRPLNLKQVAEMVGMHESTISRATSNKYIQTPQGVFEMKYFFCSGVESAVSNERFSSRSIKLTIKEIIGSEDALNPLSDQHISEMLQGNGVQISRRTVAKYRTELGIASTSQRKRY
ncbi:MAG: RNA polymerase factor sigma-54 [Chitinophagales bacterium]